MAKVIALTDIKHDGEDFKGRVLGMEGEGDAAVQVVVEEGDELPVDKFTEDQLQDLIDAGAAKEVKSAAKPGAKVEP
jgi:hypothetical protein